MCLWHNDFHMEATLGTSRRVLIMERVKHKPRVWSTAGNVYDVICVPVLWVCP